MQAVARRSATAAPHAHTETESKGETKTGIVAALRRQDDAPLDGAMRRVPLAQVAPHPDNPRSALGDLTELADSIAAFGVLQPVVVVPADAYLQAHPQHRDAIGERRWVLLAGHRRRAAAELAGKDTIDAMIRPDLAGEGMAAVAFVVENVHRSDLAPLEEARAYALLADLGVGQREIARRTGKSQSHVSKRLALLRLPQQAQDDLGAGGLTIADALALSQAPADDQAEVYALARTRHLPVTSAVSEVARLTQETKTRTKAQRQAEHEGVEVIDPHQRWSSNAHQHALYSETEVETARQQGTLLAAPTGRGLSYYSAEPVRAAVGTAARDGEDKLDVVPGGEHLHDLAAVLQSRRMTGRGGVGSLAAAITGIATSYDLVLIDCPPGSDVLQAGALQAARWVLVPTKTDDASRAGLREVARRFTSARTENPSLELLGVVLFGVNTSARRVTGAARDALSQDLGGAAPVFEAAVRHVEAAAVDARGRGQLVHELERDVHAAPKWYERLRNPGQDKPEPLAGSAGALAEDYQ